MRTFSADEVLELLNVNDQFRHTMAEQDRERARERGRRAVVDVVYGVTRPCGLFGKIYFQKISF